MNDEKKYSQREMVIAQREAFDAGVAAVWDRFGLADEAYGKGWEGSEALAAKRYPLPKVTRPRVVKDPHGYGYWTVGRDMAVRLGNPGDDVFRDVIGHIPNPTCGGVQWLPIHQYVTAERAALWADLLANPTETVDADD